MPHNIITRSWWNQVAPVCYGYSACKPGHTFGPAVREYYLLHYIFDGEGCFFRNGVTYELKKGDMFVIHPGEVTTYSASQTNPWKYCWLGFQSSEIPVCMEEPVIRQAPVRPVFSYIRDHQLEEQLDGKLFSLTYELLWTLSKDSASKEKKTSAYAAYARAYMEDSYMRRISVQEIADKVHIERRYLTFLFRQTYGIPPQTFLMNLRLDKAREFLSQGYSVSESATMAGFSDIPNFSRQYKSRFGNNPGSDRQT